MDSVTREQMLEILMLLSALESWGFSTKSNFPDYLHERLCESIETLRREILK